MSFDENMAPEIGNKDAEGWTKEFRDKHKFDFSAAGFRTIFEYLQAAMNKAGSVDPMKIAPALEGLQHQGLPRLSTPRCARTTTRSSASTSSASSRRA